MTIVGEFKDEENEAIKELRNRMEGLMETEMFDDDYVFYRFLKARDFNIDNAETMLKKHLKWREKYDVKNIDNFKMSEGLEKYIPFSRIGFDKEGCIVRYVGIGSIDSKGVLASTTFEELSKYSIYENERDMNELKKQSEKVTCISKSRETFFEVYESTKITELGRNVDKCIYIHDFKNFSLAKATDKLGIQVAIFLLDLYVNNYPERLKTDYIINASMYFSIIFKILKSVLPKTILDKIRVYSDDSYKEELLKDIDADVLPAFLGGNKTDPDGNPLCQTFILHGEKVPEEYYLSKRKKSLAKEPGVEKITLTRAKFHEVTIEVKEPGSYIEWEFETKTRDIGFGLFYQELIDGEEKITEIVPIERIDTEMYPETGSFKSDAAGTYVIVFDNTYSWVRAKEIYYRVKVVTPKEYESAQSIEETGEEKNDKI